MKDISVLDISDEKSWPKEITNYLSRHFKLLSKRAKGNYSYEDSYSISRLYDQVVFGFRPILNNYFLKGFHCSRLTHEEIRNIKSSGMRLSDITFLKERVDSLIKDHTLTPEIAKRLLLENEASEENRTGMLWFCFFAPRLAGQSGIECLFRFWGGEALYNSHERDPETGAILTGIGKPCVIEAVISIADLSGNFLDTRMINQYLRSNNIATDSLGDYEDYAEKPVTSEQIINIHVFPEQQFMVADRL